MSVISSREVGPLVIETYRYEAGPAGTVPSHSHPDYQLCLSVDFPGEVRYRGAWRPVGPGDLNIVEPGEVHADRDPRPREAATHFVVAYIGHEDLLAVSRDIGGEAGTPTFREPVFNDLGLARLMLTLATPAASALATDSAAMLMTVGLLQRHGSIIQRRAAMAQADIELARSYLEDRLDRNIRLGEVATAAGVSPYTLARLFHRQVGMPLHAYHVMARVMRGKDELRRGARIIDVADRLGFADQSHFARHFRRVVGIAPGEFVRRVRRARTF